MVRLDDGIYHSGEKKKKRFLKMIIRTTIHASTCMIPRNVPVALREGFPKLSPEIYTRPLKMIPGDIAVALKEGSSQRIHPGKNTRVHLLNLRGCHSCTKKYVSQNYHPNKYTRVHLYDPKKLSRLLSKKVLLREIPGEKIHASTYMTPKKFTVTLREGFSQNYHPHEYIRVQFHDSSRSHTCSQGRFFSKVSPARIFTRSTYMIPGISQLLSRKLLLKINTHVNIHAFNFVIARDVTVPSKLSPERMNTRPFI